MSQLHHRARSLYRIFRRHGPARVLQTSIVNPLFGTWVDRRENNVVTHNGLSYDLDAECISVFTKGALRRRSHEREERSLIETHLPKHTDVLELGAGIGYLTAFVDDFVTGDVIAVEANPRLIPVLESTRETNDLEYTVVNAAYSATNEAVEFPLSSNYKFSSVYKGSNRTATVPGIDLETLVRTYDLEECALIVDIEGSEIDLVLEELEVLQDVCHWLLIEFHARITGREALEEVRERLRDAGFDAVEQRDGVVLYRDGAEMRSVDELALESQK